MEMQPRKLEDGWLKRHFKNALTLAMRDYKTAILIFVALPMTIFFIQNSAYSMLLIGITFILGFLHFQQVDNHQDASLFSLFLNLKKNPQPIIITLFSTLLVFYFQMTGEEKDLPFFDNMFSYYMNMSADIFIFLILTMLSQFYLLLLDMFLLMFYLAKTLIKKKNLDDLEDYNYQLNGSFSTLAIHLSNDTDLPWHDAVMKSKEGLVQKQDFLFHSFMAVFLGLSISFPPLLILFFAFLQSAYKEIFWDQGISEKKTNNETANESSLVTQSN